MKERPIIMGAESVRAILEGRKTQTRRVIDPRKYNIAGWDMPRTKEDMEAGYPFAENADGDSVSVVDWCPYGRIGDRLWVRETFKIAEGVTINGVAPVIYKAECSGFALANIDNWKSPLFMPRWASRITLEITDIRVERLQDITPEDALKEGFCNYGTDVYTLDAFCEAWQKLNTKRGYPWESNPWVWVVSFKVVQSRWEQDGQNRGKVEVMVNSITLLGSPQDGQSQRQSATRGNLAPIPTASALEPSFSGPEQFDDDSIPF